MTFGIPTELLPVDLQGDIRLENHKLWLEQRRSLEANRQRKSLGEIPSVVVPGPKDVLFGRGKFAQSHVGNVRYYNIIASRQTQYDNASSLEERSLVAADILLSIKEFGGRFLKSEKTSWVVVDDAMARDKVTNAFRTRRRKLNAVGSSLNEPARTASQDIRPKRKPMD